MTNMIDLVKLKIKSKLTDRYGKQLLRLQKDGIPTDCIEQAVMSTIANLRAAKASALVIYGEPQSGKTEMMICLSAKLLDEGHKIIVHLMNDSVDLLTQNLKRFKASGLAPAPRNSSELLPTSGQTKRPNELIVFCKKNARDLEKLINRIEGFNKIIVIDDEADYATPNAKVNQGTKTTINKLVDQLIGKTGFYIGVTATPARLDLNNTFNNDTEEWVNFPPHAKYTGQDIFFPLDKKVPYRLTLLEQADTAQAAQDALVRFLVTVAYLNVHVNVDKGRAYSMLVHTSGRKQDHETDRMAIEDSMHALIDSDSGEFDKLLIKVHETAHKLYPNASADRLTEYIVENASRSILVVLNSERDRAAAGDNATEPTSPFTIIIGGNIVSRGVTFPNLLSMFFTRNVRHKLQQDTYIQRARMFGARGEYLEHFELTIPTQLYADWHRCFVFHRLALATINEIGSPVWIGDSRIAVASGASIDKATVVLDKGEMAFGMFDYSEKLDSIILKNQRAVQTLKELQEELGNGALPKFLISYIETVSPNGPESLAIHTSSSIAGYSESADHEKISRAKGFIGKPQLEEAKFPSAVHHIKIFHNANGKAKLFYKYKSSLQFVQNIK
jgi:hypothetical protein